MAETEVSAIQEECGLDMSSYEDLPKPDCNGTPASDPDNSYVFVSGADGFSDDAVLNKDVAIEGLRDLPESEAPVLDEGAKLGSQNVKLDIVSEKDGNGVQVPVADSLDKHNGKAEISQVEDPIGNTEISVGDQNGKIENLAEAEIKQVEDPRTKIEISGEASVGMVGDQNEIKQIDPNDKIDSSAEAAMEMVADKVKIKHIEDPNEKIVSSAEAATEMEGDKNEIKQVDDPNGKIEKTKSLVEAEIKQVEDPSGKIEISAEASIVMFDDQNGKTESLVEEAEIYQVEDPNEKIEVSAEAAVEMGGDEVGKAERVPEDEIKQVEDPNKTVEIVAENEIEMVGDQYENIKAVAETEQEKVENLLKSESCPCPVENQESQVGALELVSELRENEETNYISSDINNSNDEGDGQISIIAAESSVVDVIDCGSQDMSVEGEEEVKLAGEVVGNVGVDVPLATPLDLAQESDPISNKEEKALDLDVIENNNSDTAPGDGVRGNLKHAETKIVVHNTDLEEKSEEDLSVSHIDNGVQYPDESHNEPDASGGLTSKTRQSDTKNEVSVPSQILPASSVCETQAVIEISNPENIEVSSSPVDSPKSQIIQNGLTGLTSCATDGESLGSETTHDMAACAAKEPTIQSGEVHAKTEEVSSGNGEVVNSEPATFDVKLEPEADVSNVSAISSGETASDAIVLCTTEDLHSSFDVNNEAETKDVEEFGDQKEPTSQTEVSSGEAEVAKSPTTTFDVKFEPEVDVSNVSAISTGETARDVTFICKTEVLDSVDVNNKGETKDVENLADQKEPSSQTEVLSGEAEVEKIPTATFDLGLEPEVDVNNVSAISRGDKDIDVVVCKTEVLDSVDVNTEGGTKDFKDTGDQLDGVAESSNEKFLQENEDIGKSQSNAAEETSVKIKTKPFNFLIRVPRFDDESLREQIRLAKLHVDEKTEIRDAIQGQIQEIRTNSQIHGVDYEYAKGEGRNARKLVRLKRMEIDSLQSVINKAKNALSVEDINSQIYNMEHMIQHETLPLKEEKQLIREIKQLKQLREQLSSNMGSQDEIKQALEQREETEERLKILRKELDVLKNSVLKAEAAAVQAERKYDDEDKKVKELQAQFRAANDVRQAAYVEWQNLRKELSMKNTHFFRYKDDSAVASNYAFSRDTDALYSLCTNHVENFMELWNTKEEFRKDYVKFNARSTVRRLGTLDGRSLGPDEEPPIILSYFDERASRMASKPAKADSVPQISTPEQTQERNVKNVASDESMKKVTEHKNQKLTNKGPAKTVQANGSDIVSLRIVDEEVHEEPKMSKAEIELIKKAEEKRKEEDQAKLKEERRLEGLAKAKEARERKKRQAEKLQLRAELKTQKEAELKEKEREKRLRKKERKKTGATDVVNETINNSETAPSSETTIEITKDVEGKETSTAITKKPQKPWLLTKQSKTKSVPPPLRNRNKRKWQQWMWVGLTCIVIFGIFWLGNIGVFSNINLRRRSPIH